MLTGVLEFVLSVKFLTVVQLPNKQKKAIQSIRSWLAGKKGKRNRTRTTKQQNKTKE